MKKETILEHWLSMWFSPEYRQQMKLEEGEALWKKLDKELPRPTGVLKDDAARLQYFAICYKDDLSPKEKDCLKQWMEHQLYELEHHFCEQTSGSIEKYEAKWKQIYKTHLEVIS